MNLCCGLLGTAGTALMHGMGRLRLAVGSHILPPLFLVICKHQKYFDIAKLRFNFRCWREYVLETTSFSVLVARFSSYW